MSDTLSRINQHYLKFPWPAEPNTIAQLDEAIVSYCARNEIVENLNYEWLIILNQEPFIPMKKLNVKKRVKSGLTHFVNIYLSNVKARVH